MGTYWHGPQNPNQQEADRKKRLICRDNDIILIEIPESMLSNQWENEVLSQFNAKAGIQLTQQQLSQFRNFLGNTRNP